jgi:predicted Zn-dependent peptidase
MRRTSLWVGAAAIVAMALTACQPADQPAAELDTSFSVPVEYYTLDNGLRVVLSPDNTAPIVTVAVYYNVGLRLEPRDRTGFAHLFEHMMFQGSENLGKMEFVRLVQEVGGVLNGSTRMDFTNYFEIVPAHKLETMLWAEADRMKGLAITQENLTNQQGVVSNEVKVNVLNQPYGGFPWLDMPQLANTNWYNAHNFYGELSDLEAATLEDVQEFFDTFYAPNNASLAVVGDFDPAEARAWIEQYFGPIAAGPEVPEFDISEPRQEEEKRSSKVDALAPRPALAFAYHTPERNSPEYWAFGLIDQILVQGEDSRLFQRLVQEDGFTAGPRQHVQLRGSHAVDRVAVSRRRRERGRHPGRGRRGRRADPHRAGGRGDPGPGAHQAQVQPPQFDGGTVRVWTSRPPCLVRPVR